MQKKVEIMVSVQYPFFDKVEFIRNLLTWGLSDLYLSFARAGRHTLVLYTDDTLELIKNGEKVISSEVVDGAAFLAKIKAVKRVGKIKTAGRITCRFNTKNITYFT